MIFENIKVSGKIDYNYFLKVMLEQYEYKFEISEFNMLDEYFPEFQTFIIEYKNKLENKYKFYYTKFDFYKTEFVFGFKDMTELISSQDLKNLLTNETYRLMNVDHENIVRDFLSRLLIMFEKYFEISVDKLDAVN